MCQWKPDKCIIFQRRNILLSELDPQIDLNWEDGKLMSFEFIIITNIFSTSALGEPTDCVPVESNDPLYILCE